MDQRYFENRREILRKLMREAKLEALLVSLDANRFYLSGFELKDSQTDESSGCLIVTASGKDWLCTDSRYYDAATRLWDKKQIFIYQGNAAEQVNDLVKKNIKGPVGFDPLHISVDFHDRLADGVSLVKSGNLVEQLRVTKDEDEVARIEQACLLNHKLMEWIPGVLTPGRTEAQVAWDIEQFFRNHGSEGLAFSSIVAVGANAALPHAEPGQTKILDNCPVLVDVGCRMNDYCSDQTRTFYVGKPDARFTELLKHVKEAQARAIKAIKPDVPAAEVYAAANDYLKEKKLSKFFTHGLGHGVGLQTHEAPRLNPKTKEILKPGMIVTVEPGVYFTGELGIRWEHMVLVTEKGNRIL